MVNVANLKTQMEHIKNAAYELGFKRKGELITSEELIFIDMFLRILEIGSKFDAIGDKATDDDKHKLMLQYVQLQKVIATKQQAQNKLNAQKNFGDGLLRRVLGDKELEKIESEKTKEIVDKTLSGKSLTPEDDVFLDQMLAGDMEGF